MDEPPATQGAVGDADDDRAMAALRKTVERGDAGALIELGRMLERRGELDEAEAILRQAVEAGDIDALQELSGLLAGRGQRDEAEAAMRLAAREGSIPAINDLGLLVLRRGDLDEAESLFRDAAGEGYIEANYHLGQLLQQRGDLDGAEAAFRSAAKEGYIDASYDLGLLLQQRADRDESETDALYGIPQIPLLRDAPAETAGPVRVEAAGPVSFAARAVSDLPAYEDSLGFTPLVEGLRALLNVRRTRLPLAIAVTAPWGAGKSSVMLQLRQLLRTPEDRQPQERTWWTVDFPAWKYERSERLWAALAKAVYEQPQQDMKPLERASFRVRVEWERLGWRKFLLKGLWPPVAAGGAVLGVMATSMDLSTSATPAAAIVSSLAAFSLGAAHYWGVASKPFKRAMERYASAPDYEGKLGFTADADRDIRSLARVLAPDTEDNPRALAVFVDDLDRCTSTHVVEAVEAMNQIFNSDGRHGCVFVLGLDREVVATSIEVAYRPTVALLRRAKRPVGQDFGMHFLAKLVQLSVAVPRPTDAAIERLLSHITGNQPRDGELTSAERVEVERVEEAIRQQAPETLEEVSNASATVDAAPRIVEEGERRVRAELIQDSQVVIDAEFAVLPLLDRNPRQVKRFDNAFRLQLYVANEDRDCQLKFDLDELIALGKWVALRLRWPELAEALDDEPTLIAALEATANEEASPLPEQARTMVEQRYKRWFEDREVLGFLRDSSEGDVRRVASLAPGSFLRVT